MAQQQIVLPADGVIATLTEMLAEKDQQIVVLRTQLRVAEARADDLANQLAWEPAPEGADTPPG